MDIQLNEAEARVLGSLIEKSLATPDLYPLSLNSLINACNQKTSREPVTSYSERQVLEALTGLVEKGLVHETHSGRVLKYEEIMISKEKLIQSEASILGIMMLRGPQTVGELRSRSGRMYEFESLEEVDRALETLISQGLVERLPKAPGQKEVRFVQLLSPRPETVIGPAEDRETGPPVSARPDRVQELEDEVAALREELEELKAAFLEFKSQFD